MVGFVVLVAGEGNDVFRVTELESQPNALPDPDIGFTWLRSALGLMHPMVDLPDKGLMHHVRSKVSLTWEKRKPISWYALTSLGRDTLIRHVAVLHTLTANLDLPSA